MEYLKEYGPTVSLTKASNNQYSLDTPHSRNYMFNLQEDMSKEQFEQQLFEQIRDTANVWGFVNRTELFETSIRTDEPRETWVIKAIGKLTGEVYTAVYTKKLGGFRYAYADPDLDFWNKCQLPRKQNLEWIDVPMNNPVILENGTLIIPDPSCLPDYAVFGYDKEKETAFQANPDGYAEYSVDHDKGLLTRKDVVNPPWLDEFLTGDPYGFTPRQSEELTRVLRMAGTTPPLYKGKNVYITAGNGVWARLSGGWIVLGSSLDKAEEDFKVIGGEALKEYYLVKNMLE